LPDEKPTSRAEPAVAVQVCKEFDIQEGPHLWVVQHKNALEKDHIRLMDRD
jgi:hypothetical protein